MLFLSRYHERRSQAAYLRPSFFLRARGRGFEHFFESQV